MLPASPPHTCAGVCNAARAIFCMLYYSDCTYHVYCKLWPAALYSFQVPIAPFLLAWQESMLPLYSCLHILQAITAAVLMRQDLSHSHPAPACYPNGFRVPSLLSPALGTIALPLLCMQARACLHSCFTLCAVPGQNSLSGTFHTQPCCCASSPDAILPAWLLLLTMQIRSTMPLSLHSSSAHSVLPCLLALCHAFAAATFLPHL